MLAFRTMKQDMKRSSLYDMSDMSVVPACTILRSAGGQRQSAAQSVVSVSISQPQSAAQSAASVSSVGSVSQLSRPRQSAQSLQASPYQDKVLNDF